MHHRKSMILLCFYLLLPALSGPARAGHDVFHIFTPAVETGHFGFEVLSTFQNVKAAEHDEGDEHEEHGHGAPHAAHEIAFHAGVNRTWMTKLALGISREEGDSYRADTITSENVFRFGPQRSGPVDFGWFTAIAAGLNSEATNVLEFGPIVTVSSGALALTLNPFFETTFGRNREDGIAFAYAWRAAYAFTDKLAIGVEGYGEIENIGHAPPDSEQVHRIGPVIYLGHMHGAAHGGHGDHSDHAGGHGGWQGHGAVHDDDHAGARHGTDWHAEIGVLFGLTEATPDAALKLNLGVDF